MPKGARVATVDAGESAPELPAESPPKMSPDGNANPYDHSENFENMHIAQTRLSIATASREIKEITADVAEWIECQGVSVGLLTLYIPHASASLLIQENASPDVRANRLPSSSQTRRRLRPIAPTGLSLVLDLRSRSPQ